MPTPEHHGLSISAGEMVFLLLHTVCRVRWYVSRLCVCPLQHTNGLLRVCGAAPPHTRTLVYCQGLRLTLQACTLEVSIGMGVNQCTAYRNSTLFSCVKKWCSIHPHMNLQLAYFLNYRLYPRDRCSKYSWFCSIREFGVASKITSAVRSLSEESD